MKIKEIIVVEGKDDTSKIMQAVEADTIETNGSAINEEILNRIKHAKDKRGVIIFTDPDYPGERIRRLIDQHVPGCKHAFLTREQAQSSRAKDQSLGIEHASNEVIRSALAAVYELIDKTESDIRKDDLLQAGLIGQKESKQLREQLGKQLQIGHTNGKQLLKRLTQFQISKQELHEALALLRQEERGHV